MTSTLVISVSPAYCSLTLLLYVVRRFAEDVVAPKVREMDENEMMDPEIIKAIFEQGVRILPPAGSVSFPPVLTIRASSWELKRAFQAYSEGKEAFDKYRDQLINGYWAKKETRTRFVKIKVVGCWDTVGSVGVPDYWWTKPFRQAFEFYDTSLLEGEDISLTINKNVGLT